MHAGLIVSVHERGLPLGAVVPEIVVLIVHSLSIAEK